MCLQFYWFYIILHVWRERSSVLSRVESCFLCFGNFGFTLQKLYNPINYIQYLDNTNRREPAMLIISILMLLYTITQLHYSIYMKYLPTVCYTQVHATCLAQVCIQAFH